MENKKIATISLEGEKLVLALDTNLDGIPCAKLEISSLEGLKEVMALVGKIFTK